MTTATANFSDKILICSHYFQIEWYNVLAETEKALKIQNTHSKKVAWIPKSGLKLSKPGVPTYERNYDVADWFVKKMDRQQAVCLDFEE